MRENRQHWIEEWNEKKKLEKRIRNKKKKYTKKNRKYYHTTLVRVR